ncbi:iron complex outermembrane receptor protein [Pseudoduganella lurida]|uniref:Iron complex outermembrane receptor protein n=1 Tax=Pseudoduganella lurida TaxID=1036180 RepID=A0A562RKX7_9BURK|nr:TonB-dependent receptor [Pseudoduganella lurida]TWI69086.1 iron complex outermembrane receptor protein [Pseudoduganella lurida]
MIRRRPLATAVALACLAVAPGSTFAQAGDAATPEGDTAAVVVTATRNAKSVDKIPGAVSVISQPELETQYLLADDPSAALAAYVPGYSPSRQKLSSTGESLRGRTALILLDGVPQSNPLRAGMREGYFADTAIIERIEVINGASAIQGMGATGGIVNYITKTPRTDGTTFAVNVRLASQFRHDNLDWKTGFTVAHKAGDFDLLAYGSTQRRGMAYDGSHRLIGIDVLQGDTLDAGGNDLFLKAGRNFGDQRLQLTVNRFRFEGDADYSTVPANFATDTPTTARAAVPPGRAPANHVRTISLDYRHNALLGGTFGAQLFKQDFTALYGGSNTATFQDIRLAPLGQLWDQSEINADKYGAKATWVRPNLLLDGLEWTLGLDHLRDRSGQRMAGTGRTWVPTLDFRSTAPFVQLEYELGPVTVRAGMRRESADLHVDAYTTLWTYGAQAVRGGARSFSKTVGNVGAVWRFAPGWSAFAASSEGFGLPDVGVVLRGVNRPNQSVDQLFDLQAVVTRNNEVGVNWRGARGNAGISYYDSRSRLGSVIRVNAEGLGVIDRVPTRVRGWELAGEYRVLPTLSATGTYARTDGSTAARAGAPLDLALGARAQGPDKLVLGANWQWLPKSQLRLQATRLADRDTNIGRFAGATSLEEHFRGYTLADLAASYDSRWGKLGVGIDNLTDRQYIGYYPQSVRYKDPLTYFAGRGRTFSASFTRTF